jgi:hypothetical protein
MFKVMLQGAAKTVRTAIELILFALPGVLAAGLVWLTSTYGVSIILQVFTHILIFLALWVTYPLWVDTFGLDGCADT